MSETKVIKTKILMRRDSFRNWSNANPILESGEIGYDSTIKKHKIGDGYSHWNDLPYFSLSTDSVDYQDNVINKPQIESVQLEGNKTFGDLGMFPIETSDLLNILK